MAQSGKLDTSFHTIGHFNHAVMVSQVLPDGKIIVGGKFTYYNLYPTNRIARLTETGRLDTTYHPGKGANNNIHSMAFQVLVVGIFYWAGQAHSLRGFGLQGWIV